MTPWLIIGAVIAALAYIGWTRRKAKKAGKAEAEGEHLANFAEFAGKNNEEQKKIDENAGKLEPQSDAEWDDFFIRGRRPTERDRVRRDKGNKG